MEAARNDDALAVPDELDPEDAFGHHATTGPVTLIPVAEEPDDDDIDV